ncbi:MAG: MBOAT family protein [Clostridia bacterium]|nr:MBOAT family protein [Clostridia bacterium]
MGFTEITFLFAFLPISIIVYLFAEKIFHNDKVNNIILVIMSLIFYFWGSKETITLFLFIVIFVFISGQVLEKNNKEKNKDYTKLIIPLIFLIGMLVFYKYISLVTILINELIQIDIIKLGNLITPIGLSFVIFESISYLMDIYRGDAEAGTLLECFTFLSLFPKLVSGPIVLWKDFKIQIYNRRSTGEMIASGIDRIIIGYAKKAIIADTFGVQIALINNGIAMTAVDVPTIWLKAVLYFFQLYFDFSGYSDIAIGLCSVFGFKMFENFNYPYLSKSITEFWRRWHISLGTWFREYVYIPLGGNRKGNVYIHLLTVFILTGLWHGTGLQFFAWGIAHGIMIVVERLIKNRSWYIKTPSIIKWFVTTLFIFLTWVMFMSKDILTACQIYTGMFTPSNVSVDFTWQYYLTNRILVFLIISIICQLFGVEKARKRIQGLLASKTGNIIKKVFLLMLFVIDVLYVVNSTYSPFIYFQF